jgi:hypothetical protein
MNIHRKTGLALLSLVAMLLLFPALRCAGVELNALFNLGNLGFDSERVAADTGYTGQDWFWGGSVEVAHNFSENIAIKGGFYRDTVLRNVMYAMLYYNLDFFSIGIGTIQGFQNSAGTILKPGIGGSFELGFPGVMFARMLFDNSLGGQLIEPSDYLQSRSEFAVGFYVPNAICSLSFQSKKFIEQEAAQRIVDSLVAYSFKADVYQKNSPYRLLFTVGYQFLQKKFLDGSATPPVHTLNSLLAGVELDIIVTSYLTLRLGLDSAILTIGQDQLAGVWNPGPGGFLFKAQTGFSLDLENLKGGR